VVTRKTVAQLHGCGLDLCSNDPGLRVELALKPAPA